MIVKKIKPEKSKIADKIMLALLIGFVVPALLTSPFGLLYIVKGASRYYFRKNDFNREAKRLEKRGYVSLTKKDKSWIVKLSPKGKIYAQRVKFENMALPRAKYWDGKWRLFSFDIPEDHKNARDMVRRKLKSLGCFHIQRSLFAYPFDCKRELGFVAQHYKVEKYTVFAEVSYLDVDRELRQFYKL